MKPAMQALHDFDEQTAAHQQAARLYPHNPALQAEWLRAMTVVRSTTRGWVLDTFITKAASNA